MLSAKPTCSANMYGCKTERTHENKVNIIVFIQKGRMDKLNFTST